MKNQSFKQFFILIVIVCFTFFISACSDNSVGTTNDELNTCLGESIPFPATATISACIGPQSELIKGAVFDPGISWSKTLEFFSKNYSSGGWTLEQENLPTETTGERTAEWTAIGSNFDVGISITAFGNGGTGFMVGTIGMYEKGAL
jgi:hypothetical protein